MRGILPPPPTADEIDLVWLMQNKETLAAYMQAVYALANGQIVVTYQGRTLPARAVKIGGPTAIFEIFVS